MLIPDDLLYTKSHEWIKKTADDTIRIGVTAYAQQELTDVVFVELPQVGKKVEAMTPCCVVESVKAAFDIYAPVSGSIKAVNTELEAKPALVNEDCYGAGWIFEIAFEDSAQVDALMDVGTYLKLLEQGVEG